MASVLLGQVSAQPAGPTLLDAIHSHGSASHPYVSSEALLRGPAASRNLADAIHFLCALHGRHPGVIELVAARTVEPAARLWLRETADAFGRERAFLAALSVHAGPVPATPGSGSEAAVAMQRNAVLTLAQSERRGCALGAAAALAGDWAVVRGVLDNAANRFGIDRPRPWTAGDEASLDALSANFADVPAVGRAMLFGAEQVAVQHRGLWDLLAARAKARGGA